MQNQQRPKCFLNLKNVNKIPDVEIFNFDKKH